MNCFFVSDLHGHTGRYEKLFHLISEEKPEAVFIGGDILPSTFSSISGSSLNNSNFISDFLAPELNKLKTTLAKNYPVIFIIMGNDDARMEEEQFHATARKGLWEYCHCRPVKWNGFTVYGYNYIPPSPFQIKDWERYDVSRYVDPGCIHPSEGIFTVSVSEHHLKFATIAEDLKQLTSGANFERSVFLFHSPPYDSNLDRADLDGKIIDHVQVDVHVGSIAIQRLIEEKQPFLTLHGHIHESTRLTRSWQQQFGRTLSFNAAHDGPELSLIRFDLNEPSKAARELI